MRSLTLALGIALTACGAAHPAGAAKPVDAPMLFTVDQLRAGCPQGRKIELRIEMAGKPAVVEDWEFIKVDKVGATIHSVTHGEDGEPISEETSTSKWTDLHQHAKFPAATTTIDDKVELTIPAGTYTTRLYTVTDGATTKRFWFAVDLPGPPVQFSTETNGTLVMRAMMVRAK
ncbi:MAG TPA: hypothetical protein VGM39_26010 [Kofleriaceae bacterium]|jgi:hypothetical protein